MGTVVLSLTGFWRSSTGKAFAGQFFKMVQLCRDIYLSEGDEEGDEPPKITSDDLRERLGFDEETITRIHIELPSEYFLTRGGASRSDTEWFYEINQTVARFRGIETVEDYFDERAKIVAPQYPSEPWPPLQTTEETGTESVVPPTSHSASEGVGYQAEIDPRNVFVVHGRDLGAKNAMWDFLQRLGLHPLEWDEMVKETGQGTPFTGSIIDRGFSMAKAFVVLMTPDDEARLHTDLRDQWEPEHERNLTCQPRPNVIFEAGAAFGTHPQRTILVEFGRLRPMSDLAGRNVVRFGKTKAPLLALAKRLEAAGCPIDWEGFETLEPAHFAGLPTLDRIADANPGNTGPRVGRVLSPSDRPPTPPKLSARVLRQGRGFIFEIQNRGGTAAQQVTWSVPEAVTNWTFLRDELPAYPIPVLEVGKHLRIPLLILSGGPAYVDLTMRARTADGHSYETTETISTYG
jgi:predicted nucleotide-binding protein